MSGVNTNEVQFVHVQNQDDAKPAAACTALGRSYVMKKYHRQKQMIASQQPTGFRHVTQRQMKKKQREKPSDGELWKPSLPSDLPLGAKFDPFSCMAADSSELPLFLDNREYYAFITAGKNVQIKIARNLTDYDYDKTPKADFRSYV